MSEKVDASVTIYEWRTGGLVMVHDGGEPEAKEFTPTDYWKWWGEQFGWLLIECDADKATFDRGHGLTIEVDEYLRADLDRFEEEAISEATAEYY